MTSDRIGRISQIILIIAAAMMVTQVQRDATNTDPLSAFYLYNYYNGTFDAWPADVSPTIVHARILMRGLLHLGTWPMLSMSELRDCNTTLQFAFTLAALLITWNVSGRNLLAPLLAAAFVPWGFLGIGFCSSYPYDLPAMFFCAAGLWAIVRRNYFALLLVIAIGTVNKETCVYLIPAYLLAEWPGRSDRRRLLVQVGILAMAYAIAYETPRIILSMRHPEWLTVSAQDRTASRLRQNLRHLALLHPGGLFQNVWWVMLLHVPALLRIRSLPWPIRAMYYAVPFFLLPMMIFGNIFELRLFNELVPLGAVATTMALMLESKKTQMAGSAVADASREV